MEAWPDPMHDRRTRTDGQRTEPPAAGRLHDAPLTTTRNCIIATEMKNVAQCNATNKAYIHVPRYVCNNKIWREKARGTQSRKVRSESIVQNYSVSSQTSSIKATNISLRIKHGRALPRLLSAILYLDTVVARRRPKIRAHY